jgi:hypothetical protein
MAGLKGVRDADVDRTETRPLLPEEVRRVVRALEVPGAEARFGMTTAERSLLYRFAYETGIRPGQIRQLVCGAFDLDADPPAVTARPATVKRRKRHTQILRPAMAAELRDVLASRVPGALAFPSMPDKFHCAEMFRADLADARALWLAEAERMNDGGEELLRRQRSDFLAPVDHEGRRVNFYSLRHTHGTALGDAGVPQKDTRTSRLPVSSRLRGDFALRFMIRPLSTLSRCGLGRLVFLVTRGVRFDIGLGPHVRAGDVRQGEDPESVGHFAQSVLIVHVAAPAEIEAVQERIDLPDGLLHPHRDPDQPRRLRRDAEVGDAFEGRYVEPPSLPVPSLTPVQIPPPVCNRPGVAPALPVRYHTTPFIG